MNAQKTHNEHPNQAYSTSMKKPAVFSVIFHISIVILGTVGLPFIMPKKEPLEMAITVEMVDLADISQTDVLAPPREEKEPDQPPTPPAEAKPVYKKPEPQEVEPEPEPPQPPKPEEVEEIPEPPKPEEEKPVEKPKPKPPAPKPKNKPKPPAPKAPKEEKKPEEKKEPEPDIDSLLNSVLKEDSPPPSQAEDSLSETESAPTSQIARVTGQLSRSEQDDLNRGVQPCWNVNAGGKFAEELKVSLQVTIDQTMTVTKVAILDQGRYSSDTAFQAAADAARRALLNDRCKKLKLPPEKYEEWKVFTYHFDPSQML